MMSIVFGSSTGMMRGRERKHTPGAEAPFPTGDERAKAEALAYLEAESESMGILDLLTWGQVACSYGWGVSFDGVNDGSG